MVKIKPFCGIRPPQEYAAEVASRPYDVLNSVEAKAEATVNAEESVEATDFEVAGEEITDVETPSEEAAQ